MMFMPKMMHKMMCMHKMMMWPITMAFRFITVMLLLGQLMVLLFIAAMFVINTILPAFMFGAFLLMKKAHIGKHGKKMMGRHFKP